MASSSMAPLLKRATTAASNLFNKSSLFRPLRHVVSVAAPSSLRSFTRSSELSDSGVDEEELNNMLDCPRSVSLGHRFSAPSLYSGEYVLDPFAPPICLNQIFDVIDNYGWNPFAVGDPRGERVSALRRGWNVAEDENAMYLKVDMPGLGKEHVKVSVEKTTLVIKGEGEKEADGHDDDEESAGGVIKYSSRIDLPVDLFKIGEIKAEMKNGVLRVSVPKVKDDEKKDVVEVTVQ